MRRDINATILLVIYKGKGSRRGWGVEGEGEWKGRGREGEGEGEGLLFFISRLYLRFALCEFAKVRGLMVFLLGLGFLSFTFFAFLLLIRASLL